MSYQLYASDLADREWNLIKGLIPRSKLGGRRRSTSMRLVLNAIFYLDHTGCAYRYLPLLAAVVRGRRDSKSCPDDG